MDDDITRNADMNFIAIVSSFKIELDNKFEDEVKLDKKISKFKRNG